MSSNGNTVSGKDNSQFENIMASALNAELNAGIKQEETRKDSSLLNLQQNEITQSGAIDGWKKASTSHPRRQSIEGQINPSNVKEIDQPFLSRCIPLGSHCVVYSDANAATQTPVVQSVTVIGDKTEYDPPGIPKDLQLSANECNLQSLPTKSISMAEAHLGTASVSSKPLEQDNSRLKFDRSTIDNGHIKQLHQPPITGLLYEATAQIPTRPEDNVATNYSIVDQMRSGQSFTTVATTQTIQAPSPHTLSQSKESTVVQPNPADVQLRPVSGVQTGGTPLRSNSGSQSHESNTGKKSRFVILNPLPTAVTSVQYTDQIQSLQNPHPLTAGQQQVLISQVPVPLQVIESNPGNGSSQIVQPTQQSVLNIDMENASFQSQVHGTQIQDQINHPLVQGSSLSVLSKAPTEDLAHRRHLTASPSVPISAHHKVNQAPTGTMEVQKDSTSFINQRNNQDNAQKSLLLRAKSEGVNGNPLHPNDSSTKSVGSQQPMYVHNPHLLSVGNGHALTSLQPSIQSKLFPETQDANIHGIVVSSAGSADVSPHPGKHDAMSVPQNGQPSTRLDTAELHEQSQLKASHLSVPQLGQQQILPQSTNQSATTSKILTDTAAAVPADVGNIPVPVVRIKSGDGTIVKKKGRFNFIESPSIPAPQGYSGDNSVETPVIVTSNVAAQATVPGQAPVKKGRFVVMNKVEPLVAVSTVQSLPQVSQVQRSEITSNQGVAAESQQTSNAASVVKPAGQSVPTESEKAVITGSNVESDKTELPAGNAASQPLHHSSANQDASSQISLVSSSQHAEVETVHSFEPKETHQNGKDQDPRKSTPQTELDANSPIQPSVRSTRTTYAVQYGGIGKTMHHLNQMMSELTEIDKVSRLLQTENKCLKEKNKELEAKARDWERKFAEEKRLREKYETKVKELKAMCRVLKSEAKALEAEKDEEPVFTRLSRTSSTEGEGEANEKGSGYSSLGNVEEGMKGQKASKDCDQSKVDSPSTVKEIRRVTDSGQSSPMFEHPPRPPLVPSMPKKMNTCANGVQNSSNTTGSSSSRVTLPDSPSFQPIDQRTSSHTKPLEVIDAYHDSPPSKMKSSLVGEHGFDFSKFETQTDFETVGTSLFLGAPPRPNNLSGTSWLSSDNVLRVPGSSLTKSFDPYAVSTGSLETTSTDSESQAINKDLSIHQYNYQPIPKVEPIDSMNQGTNVSRSNSIGHQGPMFLIEHQAMASSHPLSAESNDMFLSTPMMTYKQPVLQQHNNHQPVNGFEISSSRDHSRNPSVCPAPTQSWSNSPINQEAAYPDLLSSDDIGMPTAEFLQNDHTSANYNNNNSNDVRIGLETATILLKHIKPIPPHSSSLDESLIDTTTTSCSASRDPFDPLAQRKVVPDDSFIT